MRSKLIIANMSGFYGDRLSAAAEMVRGGPIDVLTGDYLSELTMAILHRQRARDPAAGYVATFLRQMQDVLGECLARGIRVVSNAGGLNPRGLAQALEKLASAAGLHPKIAFIEGDDLSARIGELRAAGERFENLDTGRVLEPAGDAAIVTANAYLGGWGIKEALDRGADIVVCPRVTDAALAVGPAAWAFGWRRDDWDRLAGAVVAGHVLECGTQATGGNYAFFEEVPSFQRVGFPLAELFEDGSFVVGKHPSTGGLVSIGTVTAQLLYEIQGARYANPDAIARFDTIRLVEEGPDRVRVEGVRGEPAPEKLKLCINLLGGHRNSMTVILSGRDLERKAELVREMLAGTVGAFSWELLRTDREDPRANVEATAQLRIHVADRDAARVGRRFSSAVVELALAGPPGITLAAPPEEAVPYYVHFPALIDRRHVEERVVLGEDVVNVAHPPSPASCPEVQLSHRTTPSDRSSESRRERVPLGRIFGARSGDKGGDATLGVWAKTPAAYAYLERELTSEYLHTLIPEAAGKEIQRTELPNLHALLFVLRGFLGEGVAASTRFDPQAKTLAEYLRAKMIDVPADLLSATRD